MFKLKIYNVHAGFFKLADRMRSMRTNGASKNQDYPVKMDLFFLSELFLVKFIYSEKATKFCEIFH